MANIEELKEEALENAAGGQTTNPGGAHWQDLRHQWGESWTEGGYLWYRINRDDTLGKIAAKFGTSVSAIQSLNPGTITNVNLIQIGDTIRIRRA